MDGEGAEALGCDEVAGSNIDVDDEETRHTIARMVYAATANAT